MLLFIFKRENWGERPLDGGLLGLREENPGFYPVKALNIHAIIEGDKLILSISYPKKSNSTNEIGMHLYHIAQYQYTVCPILKLRYPMVPFSSTFSHAESIPSNLFSMHIITAQALIHSVSNLALTTSKSLVEGSKDKTKDELLKEAMQTICETCKKIESLLVAAMRQIKLSSETEELIKEEAKKLLEISKLVSASEDPKKISLLQEIYESFNTIDGYLRLEITYASPLGIGNNINRLIKQLKNKINKINRTPTVSYPLSTISSPPRILFSKDATVLSKPPSHVSISSMREVDVPGDGSCFFYCVALSYLLPVRNDVEEFKNRFSKLFSVELVSYAEMMRTKLLRYTPSKYFVFGDSDVAIFVNYHLRKILVRMMMLNKSKYEPFIKIETESFEERMRKMVDPVLKEWVEQSEITATCDLLEISIVIHQRNELGELDLGKGTEHGEAYGSKCRLNLVYFGRNHYHFLIEDKYIHAVMPSISESSKGNAHNESALSEVENESLFIDKRMSI